MEILFAPYFRNFNHPLKTGTISFSKREGYLLKKGNRYAEASPLPGFSNNLNPFHDTSPSLDFALSALDADIIWKDAVHVAALIGIEEQSLQIIKVKKYIQKGYQTFKIKISPDTIQQTVDILEIIKQENPSIKIRLDSNHTFSKEQALHAISLLNFFSIEYWEDPLRNDIKIEELSKHCSFPFAIDEGLQNDIDFQKYLDSPYQYYILKPSLIGSEEKIKKIIAQITKAQKNFIFSSALESEIGLKEIYRLASVYGNERCQGLDTLSFFDKQFFETSPVMKTPPELCSEGLQWLQGLSWKRLPK